MSSFRDKFKDRTETVQRDGTSRKDSLSTNASSRLSQRKTTAQTQVQIAGPRSSQTVHQPPGTLLQEHAVVVPKYQTSTSPIAHSSHHLPSLGVSPKAAEGYMTKEERAMRQAMTVEESEEQKEEEVVKYFKRHERRLAPLPDFKSPPPIWHGRRVYAEPKKEPMIGDYRPHNFRDYKKMVDSYEHQKFGGLGPSDSPEKQVARAKQKKMFDYGRSVNAVNFTIMEVPEPQQGPPQAIPRKLDREAQLGLIKRQRALKYGEQFSHPVFRSKARTPQPDSALEAELARLREKHSHDAEEIARIKELLQLEER